MKKILTVALFLLLVVLFAVSCKDNDTPAGTDGGDLQVFLSDGSSDYTLVYPLRYSSSSEGGQAVAELKDLIETNVGSFWEVKSDYVASETDLSSFDGAKEILLGETNRKESALAAAGLREKDYVIKVVDKKLVVVGGSDAANAAAIRRFAAMFFSKPQTALILREDYVYEYRHDYALNSLTLDGVPLSSFTIVYDPTTESDARYLQNALLDLTGYRLSLSTDSEAENTIEFALSNEAGCFASLKNGVLTLSGDTASNRAVAVSRFIDALSSSDSDTLALDSGFSIDNTLANGVPLTVFDLNLYSTGYGENSVNNRYPRLMTLIDKYRPSILCLQDVSPTWLSNMKNGRDGVSPLTDTYAYVGTGRNNDDESVMQAIFYDKSLYTLKDSGTFWLSETPEWESVGWDGRTRSICTWAILTEKTSGKEFAVMNTMLDPYGKKAQRNGAALILERAEALGVPVILAGDMQNISTNSVITTFTEYAFSNASVLADSVGEMGATVNAAFGNVNSFSSASDFVLASYGEFQIESYTLLKDLVEEEYVSNHWPILTKLVLN